MIPVFFYAQIFQKQANINVIIYTGKQTFYMAQNSLTSSYPIEKEVILDLKVNDRNVANVIIETQKALENLKKTKADYDKRLKEGQQLTQEEWENYIKTKTEINDLNNTLKANQKILDESIKANKNNGDSINAMRAQIKKLRAEYEDLNAAERNSETGTKLLEDINKYTDAVKEAEYAQKDFRRNVGNYPEAQNAKTALRELRIECQNLSLELYTLQGAKEAQQSVVNNLAATVGTENAEYQKQVEELNKLNAAYETTQAELSKMEQEAGKLSDTLSDSSKRISSFANDQQKIAAAQEGVQLLTASYTAINGALAAVGLQSKSLLEIYAKIEIFQKSINSLMTIYKTLNKDSNLRLVLRNKLEQARLTWTKAYNEALKKQNTEIVQNTTAETAQAAATTGVTVAETAATTATFSFKAALEALKVTLLSNPFTAIMLGVAAVATAIGVAVSKIVKKNKEAEESEQALAEQTKKVTAEYKKSADQRAKSMESITGKYTSQIANIKALLSVVRSENAAYAAKVKAMNELNRLVPEYNGKLSATGKIIQENNTAIESYVNNLKQQAEAAATMNILTSAYETKLTSENSMLKAKQDLEYYQRQFKYWLGKRDDLWLKYDDKNHEEVKKAQHDLEWFGDRVKATESYIKDLEKAVQNADKQIEQFSNKAKDIQVDKPTSTTTTDNTALKTAQEQYNEMLKIVSDYYKSIEKIQEDSIQTLTDKENARYAGEKSQLEKALSDAQKLYDTLSKDPKLLKELQKDNKYLSLTTLKNQIQIINDNLDEAAEKHDKNLKKISLETMASFIATNEKLQRDLDLASDNLTVKYTIQLKERLEALDAELQKELDEHEYTEQQKLIITEKYNQKRLLILKEFSSGGQFGNYDNINNMNVLNSQLAADLAELEARKQAELSVFEGTEAEKAAIVEKYARKRVDIENAASNQEAQIWLAASMNIASAMASAMGSMSDLLNTIAQDDAKMQKYSKALAAAQIAISTGVSIAQAVQAAVQAGGFTGPAAPVTIPVFIAELVAIVASAVASATSLLKGAGTPSAPRFATGGPVDRSKTGGMIGNRTTTRKDDTIDAKLSEGEYVVQSKIVKKYGIGFFDELNETKKTGKRSGLPLRFASGGSVPSVQNIQSITTQMDYTKMEEMFARVVENINPVVSVQEINTAQTRVQVKENTASYK